MTPSERLPKHVGDLGYIIVATDFEKLPKVQKSPNKVTLLPLHIEEAVDVLKV